ncbi:E3 ubiquitin-protein ligase synoviolin B-like isoform X2 [Dreissena polymorpha]|nr:E3 ubiquitin-protein ligase synoviolin B-like isoform X2 [Dreissena polymorpha]
MGKLVRKIFFGQLRAAEMEHLIERSWYAVTETCLAFTVFRDDFSPRFVAAFTLLLFLKCFHWLAEDRVDFMERSPVISFLFHVRVVSLLTFLSVIDAYFVNYAYYSTLSKGASVQLVFGFEYAILITIVMMAVMKYLLHSIDLQSENPWENKAVYLLYSELVLGFVKVILYMMFMIIMIKIHTFPLFAIRPMYLAVRNFKKSLHDVIMSRRAIRQMNTLYPDVSQEELESGDNVCIICREDMVSACKKLPCNHIFHTSCLRSWFQRQQTCPTCRMEVLQMTPLRSQPTPPPHQQQQHIQNPFQNLFPGGFPPIPPGALPQMPQMWPPQMAQGQPPQMAQRPPPQMAQGQPPQTLPASTPGFSHTTPTVSAAGTTPLGASASFPDVRTGWGTASHFVGATTMPAMFPPMFMPNNFPRPPTSLDGLSDEELRAMEGVERGNIEARIQWLRDIQALLDGAMLLMQQYNIVAAASSIPGINLTAQNPSVVLPSGVPQSYMAPPGQQTGAIPKHRNTAANFESVQSSSSQELSADSPTAEGAQGLPTTDEFIPEWVDPREESKDIEEVRRRRLEKFESESPKSLGATSLDSDEEIPS